MIVYALPATISIARAIHIIFANSLFFIFISSLIYFKLECAKILVSQELSRGGYLVLSVSVEL